MSEPDPLPAEVAPPARPSATILFDGVCNLCNASVQWVLERDSTERFHFASLQSDAARRVLEAAGVADPESLPDSIVLVDAKGVHVRSAAALRIAMGLGFPYSMLALGLLLPRPLRDGAYRIVARHRYRWFGHRETCMRPTPELAGRFLDADEAQPLVGVSGVAGNTEAEGLLGGTNADRGSWVGGWLVRLVAVYFVVYMAPFPLSLLGYLTQVPGLAEIPALGSALGWIIGLWGGWITPLTTWVGDVAFGVDATPAATGSGDTTYNYVELVVKAGIAVVLSAAWTGAARGRRVSARAMDAARTLTRYYLATTMLTYGWIKVFPLQFQAPGPDRLIQPFGDASPMGLAWTFLGASMAYQVFAGLSELVAGYLLFWRRTALAGALMGTAVMSNVVAINFFFDVPVKLFSAHLVLAALFVAAPDLPRLVGYLGFNLPISPRVSTPFSGVLLRRRKTVMAVHLLFVAALTGFHVTSNLQAARSYGYLAEPSPLAGIYRVEAFERDGRVGRENEDVDRWVRVGFNPPFSATIQRASGHAVRMRLQVDEESGMLSLYDRAGEAPASPMFTYSEPEPGKLRLSGVFEGASTTLVVARDTSGALLVERGFHWVNEYPFNR